MKELQEAIQASQKEHSALVAIQAELTKTEAKLKDIDTAMRKLRDDRYRNKGGETRSIETRVVAGVSVPVETVTSTPDDLYVLSGAMDLLRKDEQRLRKELQTARSVLSSAVAKRLMPQQKKLQARTVKVLEEITALCKDGSALEAAMIMAGLADEHVYAVRFPQLQRLRLDESGSCGLSIKASLEEAA